MNKKIKIIDLVNRIESGEKVPEKIKYNQLEFKYDKESGKYIRKNSSIITWFCIERFTNDFLNKTVEILEDNTEEIEELKTINQMQKYRIEVIDERELISKDTIKEILGIEENIDNEKLLSLLQTIVDENARLEDIEDRKVQIEYNNVFNKGVKSVEDKIKAKIEEVDIQLQKLKDGLTGRKTNFVNKNMLFAQKKALQSLLEKE